MARLSKAAPAIVAVVMCAVALMVSPYNAAAAVVPMSLSELAQASDSVVIARVSTHSARAVGPLVWRNRDIVSDSRLRVQRVLKGARPSAITVTQPGGQVGAQVLMVSELPEFHSGERVVLFLNASGGVVGGYQGKLRIVGNQVPEAGMSLSQVVARVRAVNGLPALSTRDVAALTSQAAGAVSDGVVSGAEAVTGALAISSITPGGLNAGIGDRVLISGAGFGTTAGTVTFPDGLKRAADVATIVSWDDTAIVCEIPRYAESGSVVVTLAGATASGSIPYTVGFSTNGSRWANPAVAYRINENSTDLTGEGAAIQRAFSTWNTAGSRFRFSYAGPNSSTVANPASTDGFNDIYFAPGGFTDARIIAWNKWWGFVNGDGTLEIVESDIVFNDAHWFGDGAVTGRADVQTVVLHELGHSLCIDDQYDNLTKAMGAVVIGTTRRNLSQAEIDGVLHLYDGPTRPSISSSSHPSVSAWFSATSAMFTVGSGAPAPATVAGYSYVIDGSPVTVPDAVTDGASGSIALGGLSDGIRWFHVRAGTSGSVWGPTAHYRLNVDLLAPLGDVRIGDPATSTVSSRLFSIDATLSDAASGLDTMRVDSGAGWSTWTPYAGHVDSMLPYADGTYTVKVEYRDKAGNVRLVTRAITLSMPPVGSVVETTAITLTAPSVLAYDATATLYGTLVSEMRGPLASMRVALEAMPYGATLYSQVATVATTASGGYSFAVKPKAKTNYRVVFTGDASHTPVTSVSRTVLPAASVSTPVAPASVSRLRSYTIYGYLRPAHPVGQATVRMYRWRWNGSSWVSYGYIYATTSAHSSVMSKYSLALRFPSAGRWRVRAYHADSAHAGAWSPGYDYITSK